MSKRQRRSAILRAVLTLNAFKPIPPGNPAAIPSFFAGWATSEMAPQSFVVTAAATARGVLTRKSKRDNLALAINLATLGGLGLLIRRSLGSKSIVETSLREVFPSIADGEPDIRREVLLRHAAPLRFAHPDVEVIREIQYTGTGARHRLDIYRPRGPVHNAPVLLHIHGGAWVIGRKEEQGLPLMNYLASRGWICVSANYRLSPKATWPDHIIDVKSALIWIKRHIHEYGGDPGFIAVTGGSAGGHLCSLLALTPNKPEWQPGHEDVDTSVQACVPHYGVYDMADILQLRGGVRQRDVFLGPTVFKSKYSEDPAPYLDASPLEHCTDQAPPFLVVHGTNDSLADVTEARVFVERLRAVSKQTVTYIELPGTQHAFDVFHSLTSATVVRGVARWLEQIRAQHATQQSGQHADSIAADSKS